MMTDALDVAAPGIRTTGVKIVQVALVGVGLALKRDVTVGVAAHRQPDDPLHHIGHVEKHEQHLALLCRVDALVVHQFLAQIDTRVHKQDAHQVDGHKAAKGQYVGADDFHGGKVTIIF